MKILYPVLILAAALGAGLTPSTADAQETTLSAAYKREFAVLESEKVALTRRRDELQAESRSAVREAEGELARLQARALSLREQADALDESLRRAEPESDTAEGDALLQQLFERADGTLSKEGSAPPRSPEALDGPEVAAHIKIIFSRVPELVRLGGAVSRSEGTFFLRDGTQVKGELLRVGHIATYGLSERGQGALAPAGEGRLKIWDQDASATSQALFSGKKPASVGIFLHEGLDKAIEAPEEKTALSIVKSGGSIAWVIVVLGFVALILIVARLLILAWSGLGTGRLLARVEALVVADRRAQALDACKRSRGPTARVLSAAVTSLDEPPETQERLIAEALLGVTPSLERFGTALTVFAAVAPLLGLLGTVTGMIATFDIITEFGTGDPKMLSGGISEALITTELGLLVAIPTLLIGSLLAARAEALQRDLERGALRILNAKDSPSPPISDRGPVKADMELTPQAAFAATAGIVGE